MSAEDGRDNPTYSIDPTFSSSARSSSGSLSVPEGPMSAMRAEEVVDQWYGLTPRAKARAEGFQPGGPQGHGLLLGSQRTHEHLSEADSTGNTSSLWSAPAPRGWLPVPEEEQELVQGMRCADHAWPIMHGRSCMSTLVPDLCMHRYMATCRMATWHDTALPFSSPSPLPLQSKSYTYAPLLPIP